MSIFIPIRSETTHPDDKSLKLIKYVEVPVPTSVVAHAVIESKERLTVIFIRPRGKEFRVEECVTRACSGEIAGLKQELVTRHSGQGCFSASHGSSRQHNGYTVIAFKKNAKRHSMEVPVYVIEQGEAKARIDKQVKIDVEFEIAFPPGLAEFYSTKSYDRALKADWLSAEDVNNILEGKKVDKVRPIVPEARSFEGHNDV